MESNTLDPLNPVASAGFSNSEHYDKHRPSYPPEAVDVLLEGLKIAGVAKARILDLAAGTGKFTELLACRPEEFVITAVEPHDKMLAVLEAKKLRQVDVKSGSATQIPLADHSAEAVIIAQAFHWFANVDALKEIHRVLQPGGSLGLIWNVEDYNQAKSATLSTKWEAKLHELLWSLDDNEPRFKHHRWQQAFDDQLKPPSSGSEASGTPLFSVPLKGHDTKWTVWLTQDALWDRFNTLSWMANLDEDARQRARKAFDDAVSGDDIETNEKGELAVHGHTVIRWTAGVFT